MKNNKNNNITSINDIDDIDGIIKEIYLNTLKPHFIGKDIDIISTSFYNEEEDILTLEFKVTIDGKTITQYYEDEKQQ